MALHPDAYHVDFCTGSGMLGMAVKIAFGMRIRTVAYVERQAFEAAHLVGRMDEETVDKAPVWDDVTTTTSPEFLEAVEGFRPLILSAGYPCQGFSLAGKRLGARDPRHLWPFIDEFIGAARPECVFLENVANHLRLGFGQVRRDLQSRGYRVKAGIFSAEEMGASHRRERLFILALADSRSCNRQTGAERSRRETRADIGGRGEGPELADPNGIDADNRGYDSGTNGGKQPQPAEVCGSEQLAHSQRDGRESSEVFFKGGRESVAPDSIQELAHTGCAGFQGGEWPGSFQEGRQESFESIAERCLSVFAPGRGSSSSDEWREILETDPTLEPAVCRAPDGMASGMDSDRLRVAGNGVVTLAAAYAFVTLFAALTHSPGR